MDKDEGIRNGSEVLRFGEETLCLDYSDYIMFSFYLISACRVEKISDNTLPRKGQGFQLGEKLVHAMKRQLNPMEEQQSTEGSIDSLSWKSTLVRHNSLLLDSPYMNLSWLTS